MAVWPMGRQAPKLAISAPTLGGMRAWLATLAIALPAVLPVPVSAGTWEPAQHVGPLRHFAVSPTGTALVGGARRNYDEYRIDVMYSRVTSDGVVEEPRTLATYPGFKGGFIDA